MELLALHFSYLTPLTSRPLLKTYKGLSCLTSSLEPVAHLLCLSTPDASNNCYPRRDWHQGASLVDTFLPLAPKWQVRAVTRNPESAAAKSLSSRGVEVVMADTGDVSTLHKAFAGATAIFAVTDYWSPFFSSPVQRYQKDSCSESTATTTN